MNVYEAVATSPIGAAMHERGSAVAEKASWLKPWDEQYPDGWQPLAALEDAEQWKERAEKAEAQLAEALTDLETLSNTNAELRKQLAGEYTLGKPLKKAKNGKRYIAIHKETGEILQGQFIWTGPIQGKTYTYYADPRLWPQKPEATTDYNAVNKITGKMYQGTPRPMPVLPEVKEEPKLIHEFYEGNYCLTAEGRRRLEGLLRDYVPLSEYIGG